MLTANNYISTSANPEGPALRELIRLANEIALERGCSDIQSVILAKRARPDLYRAVCEEEEEQVAQ